MNKKLFISFSDSILNSDLFNNFFIDEIGAVVSFAGVIRQYNMCKSVDKVQYFSFNDLALSLLTEKCKYYLEIDKVIKIFIYQRFGTLKVGDINLLIGISSVDRCSSFLVCSDLVEFIKTSVPIWKKEYYVDSTYSWINSF